MNELYKTNLDFLKETLGIDPKQFKLTGLRHVGQANRWKGVNITEGVPLHMKNWNIENITQIKRGTSREFIDGVAAFQYESTAYQREWLKYKRNVVNTTSVFVDEESGDIVVRVQNTMDFILFQENLQHVLYVDGVDTQRVFDWFGAYQESSDSMLTALSTDEYRFTALEQQIVEPVYNLSFGVDYEDGVAVFTPTLLKDGVIVPANVRWEYDSSIPSGFQGKFGDTESKNVLRVTTNSRNRDAVFILSPKAFSFNCFANGVNGLGLPIRIKASFLGDLNLPELVIL